MNVERKIFYKRYEKLPIIKLENLAFDNLIIHVEGDIIGTCTLSKEYVEFWVARHKGPPEHYNLKVAPWMLLMPYSCSEDRKWRWQTKKCPHSSMDRAKVS